MTASSVSFQFAQGLRPSFYWWRNWGPEKPTLLRPHSECGFRPWHSGFRGSAFPLLYPVFEQISLSGRGLQLFIDTQLHRPAPPLYATLSSAGKAVQLMFPTAEVHREGRSRRGSDSDLDSFVGFYWLVFLFPPSWCKLLSQSSFQLCSLAAWRERRLCYLTLLPVILWGPSILQPLSEMINI